MNWSDLARRVRGFFGSVPTGLEPFDLAPLGITDSHWLEGNEVQLLKMHSSWHYPTLSTPDGLPRAVVAHYTATAANTAVSMARRRGVARAFCRNWGSLRYGRGGAASRGA